MTEVQNLCPNPAPVLHASTWKVNSDEAEWIRIQYNSADGLWIITDPGATDAYASMEIQDVQPGDYIATAFLRRTNNLQPAFFDSRVMLAVVQPKYGQRAVYEAKYTGLGSRYVLPITVTDVSSVTIRLQAQQVAASASGSLGTAWREILFVTKADWRTITQAVIDGGLPRPYWLPPADAISRAAAKPPKA